MKRKMPILWKCLLWGAVTLVALVVIWILWVNSRVLHGGGAYILTDTPERDGYDAILVLGAGIKEDGTPSNMLEDRLRYGVELYRQGVAPRIILSGDCSGEAYDEVSAMERYCLAQGIPKESLIRDEIGFSTYESMYNFKENGGGRVLVVTQRYHLYRALYIAREMGVEADGFPSDPRPYRNRLCRELREVGARWKDALKVSRFS